MALQTFHWQQGEAIPREVTPGELSTFDIHRIGGVVFRRPEPKSADALFIFGSVQGDWLRWAKAIHAGHFGRVILAGQSGPNIEEYLQGRTLARAMADRLVENGVPRELLTLQATSLNTLEDVAHSLPHLEGVKSIAFAAKSHHSGRCYLTLRRFFPHIPLFSWGFDAQHKGQIVEERTWHLNPAATSVTFGEFLRIQTYSSRGDIAIPEVL